MGNAAGRRSALRIRNAAFLSRPVRPLVSAGAPTVPIRYAHGDCKAVAPKKFRKTKMVRLARGRCGRASDCRIQKLPYSRFKSHNAAPAPFRKFRPAQIRIVRQNLRTIESDVCNPARARNVCRRPVQVAEPA